MTETPADADVTGCQGASSFSDTWTQAEQLEHEDVSSKVGSAHTALEEAVTYLLMWFYFTQLQLTGRLLATQLNSYLKTSFKNL